MCSREGSRGGLDDGSQVHIFCSHLVCKGKDMPDDWQTEQGRLILIVGNLVFLYRSPIEMHNTGRAEAELKADDEGVDKIDVPFE